MTDYAGNTNKDKEKKAKSEKVKPKIEKVVKGEVSTYKKPLGRKIKDIFIMADFRSVGKYLLYDIFIPEIRNMVADAGTKGIQRIIYGERAIRRRDGIGSRISYTPYSSPVQRGYGYRDARPVPLQSAVADSIRRTSGQRRETEPFVLSSREEADEVLEMMNNIIESYDVVSVADLNELVGAPTTYQDQNWGWTFLGDAQVRQIREGYLIELPEAEPIT